MQLRDLTSNGGNSRSDEAAWTLLRLSAAWPPNAASSLERAPGTRRQRPITSSPLPRPIRGSLVARGRAPTCSRSADGRRIRAGRRCDRSATRRAAAPFWQYERRDPCRDYLESLGHKVENNEQEGQGGAGRQGDAYVDKVKTEFKSLRPGATSVTVKNSVSNSIKRGGKAREIVLDARGSGLSEAEALVGLERAAHRDVSRGMLDKLSIIGDEYYLTRVIE